MRGRRARRIHRRRGSFDGRALALSDLGRSDDSPRRKDSKFAFSGSLVSTRTFQSAINLNHHHLKDRGRPMKRKLQTLVSPNIVTDMDRYKFEGHDDAETYPNEAKSRSEVVSSHQLSTQQGAGSRFGPLLEPSRGWLRQKDPAMFPLQIASLTSVATLIVNHLSALSSRVLMSTLSMSLMISASWAAPSAWAQSDDSGDFTDGDEGAAPNTDSDPVPGLSMSTPTYGGTGCPQGTASTVLSPDGKTLTVIFDAYIAQANSSLPRDQKGCQINIPFQVPAGYQVQVVKMDYRGFTNLPQGARSTFGAGFRYLEVNGQATNNPRVLRARVLQGPRQQEFKLTSILRGARFSPCGSNFILAAESMLNVASNRRGEEAFATVDSLDAVALPVVYSLRWKRCSVGPGGEVDGDGRVRPHPGRPHPGRPPRPFPGPGRR